MTERNENKAEIWIHDTNAHKESNPSVDEKLPALQEIASPLSRLGSPRISTLHTWLKNQSDRQTMEFNSNSKVTTVDEHMNLFSKPRTFVLNIL